MTTFGKLFVQKRPVKDGYQNFVHILTVGVVNYGQQARTPGPVNSLFYRSVLLGLFINARVPHYLVSSFLCHLLYYQ